MKFGPRKNVATVNRALLKYRLMVKKSNVAGDSKFGPSKTCGDGEKNP